MPIETVSKMLGHRSLKQAMIYAKILDVKISEDIKGIAGAVEGRVIRASRVPNR